MLDVPRSKLEFTPLEFETNNQRNRLELCRLLEFTPLEFETYSAIASTYV